MHRLSACRAGWGREAWRLPSSTSTWRESRQWPHHRCWFRCRYCFPSVRINRVRMGRTRVRGELCGRAFDPGAVVLVVVDGDHGLLLGIPDLSLALVDGGAVDGLDVAGRDLKEDVFHAGGDVLFAVVGGHGLEVVAGLLELLHLGGEVIGVALEVDGRGVVEGNFSGGDEGLARRRDFADRGWAVLC